MENQEQKEEKVVKFSRKGGIIWPYFEEKKALSSSSLTDILKEIEYQDKKIPKFVLLKAAENGKIFHKAIQNFLEKNDEKWYKSFFLSRKTVEKIEETISFFKSNKFEGFLSSEVLYHTFYEGEFFASYVDLDFKDFVIELKTNNTVINESKISVLVFRIQLLVQSICTRKKIHLLWSTGVGVYFEEFRAEQEIIEVLKVLINIVKNKETYSFEAKKEMIEKVLTVYSEATKSFLLR